MVISTSGNLYNGHANRQYHQCSPLGTRKFALYKDNQDE